MINAQSEKHDKYSGQMNTSILKMLYVDKTSGEHMKWFHILVLSNYIFTSAGTRLDIIATSSRAS